MPRSRYRGSSMTKTMTTTGAMEATSRARAFSVPGRRRERAAGARIAALFEEHGRMVYGVCRLMLRDPVEAEDAAQQSFLSAYRALLGGQDPREASAWLGTIARNECRTRLRGRRTEPLTLVREPVGDELQREVDRHDEIRALCSALAELPPQQRDAIVLREFYGLSYAEVGAALGLSGAAVESVIFRSRKRLQDYLRPARSALGVLTLPLSLRESLAQALPGFGGSSAAAGAGAGAAVAAKVAAVTLAVGAAGTVAGLESTHVARQHVRPPVHSAPATAVHRPVAVAPRPVQAAFVSSSVRAPSATVAERKAPITSSRSDPPETESHSGSGSSGMEQEHSGGGDRTGGGSGHDSSHDSGATTTDHSGSGDSGSSHSGDSGSDGGGEGSGHSGESD